MRKRVEDGPGAALLDTLVPLLYRVGVFCYNKSHLPAIIEFTRTDDKGLAATAHELLKEISTKHPKVFSTHVKDLCNTLENEAPTAKAPNPPGAVDDLKACAAFAKQFPAEIPINNKEGRKLAQSLMNFALYGTPPQAAKHATTIIMSSDDKKELHAKEILTKSIKNFSHNGDHWLTKLAALSQLVLLAPSECEDDMDAIIEIAIQKVLQKPHAASTAAEAEWMDEPDEDIQGRIWAIKILVNRLRSLSAEAPLNEAAEDTYALLNRLVKEKGEGSDDDNTPAGHKSRQRLLAANSLLKLSCNRRLESLLTPADFVQLALVTHDPCLQVRKGFADKLMRYLGQNRLPRRFYTILFFLAHEPEKSIKNSTMTWIRSRRAAFTARKDITLETVFARLLSLLAHHPDFDTDDDTLLLMSEYILFYLKTVATEDNLSLIFHVAQRVKSVADGITQTKQADENFYVLSDLSQALIRSWEEQNGWTMQSWSGKMKLPTGIFRPLESHEQAQKIANKTWISEELVEQLDPIVRKAIRNKKRRTTDDVEKPRKKVKTEKPAKERKTAGERPTKATRKKRRTAENGNDGDVDGSAAASREPRRKSGRQSTARKSYIEVSTDDEDASAGEEEESDTSGASDRSTPAPGEDVEMAEGEAEDDASAEEVREEEAEEEEDSPAKQDEEASPEPEPPKRTARGKAQKKAPAAAPSMTATPVAQKRKAAESAEKATPAKTPKSTTRGKAKAKETSSAPSSSPAAAAAAKDTALVRRSGRNRG